MFCPKCGTQNSDDGKFCRGCGANLSNVLEFVDGNLTVEKGRVVEPDLSELYSKGVKNVILGFGFLIAGIFLFMIPPHGILWLLLMMPGFAMLASGISNIVKSDSIKKERESQKRINKQPIFISNQPIRELPTTQADYIKPQNSIYKTEDLVGEPPSVTEDTTRQLLMDAENETMTLPKK